MNVKLTLRQPDAFLNKKTLTSLWCITVNNDIKTYFRGELIAKMFKKKSELI